MTEKKCNYARHYLLGSDYGGLYECTKQEPMSCLCSEAFTFGGVKICKTPVLEKIIIFEERQKEKEKIQDGNSN